MPSEAKGVEPKVAFRPTKGEGHLSTAERGEVGGSAKLWAALPEGTGKGEKPLIPQQNKLKVKLQPSWPL